MLTRLAAAVALLTAACVPGPAGVLRPLTVPERQARDVAILAWEIAQGEPLPEHCEANRERMKVTLVSTHAEMQSAASYYCGPSRAPDDGTLCRYGRVLAVQRPARTGGLWPFALFEAPWPLIVMWHDVASPRLLAHEVEHWLDDCFGLPARRHYAEDVGP